ncbi:MAG: hypothetical protein OFPI_29510 [Osedax symbiont Rs2]|nr:MAG: hypothetical protein OFPI_29510 [Osedax symbiont Rs2]
MTRLCLYCEIARAGANLSLNTFRVISIRSANFTIEFEWKNDIQYL